VSIWDLLDSLPKRGDVSPEELAARRQGYADLYAGGFLSRNSDQMPLSVQGAQAAQDFIPGIGDAIAFGEAGQALSEGDRRAAALLAAGGLLGVVPGVGDALARPIMAAGRKVADAIPSEALYAGRSLAEGDMRGVLDAFAPSRPAQGLSADVVKPSLGIRAYHGTPHEFPPAIRVLDKETGKTYVQEMGDPVATGLLAQNPERYQIIEENPLGMFDFSKMGTGEGAQAYGWGGYLAEGEGVAKSYRDALSLDAGFSYKGKDGLTRDQIAEAIEADFGRGYLDNVSTPRGVADNVMDELIYGNGGRKLGPERTALRDNLRQSIGRTDSGNMYEVNINADPADFLDWDAPLSAQPQSVRDAVVGISAGDDALLREILDTSPEGMMMQGMVPNAKGSAVYRTLMDRGFEDGAVGLNLPTGNPMKPADKWASDRLREAGIPGIKYFDAGSRGVGEGTRNYVVFDENLINIVKKYGIAGAAAMLGASVMDVEQAMAQGAQQQPQGLLSMGAQ